MKFYTTAEIADILKVSKGTIHDWIKREKLQAVRLGGTKTLRVSEDALNAFLERNKV